MFRLLNYRPANRNNSESSLYFKELEVMDSIRMKYYVELVAEGKADGSINPNLDTTKAVYFLHFSHHTVCYILFPR